MTPQEVVAENLLLHQLDFLRAPSGWSAIRKAERSYAAARRRRIRTKISPAMARSAEIGTR